MKSSFKMFSKRVVAVLIALMLVVSTASVSLANTPTKTLTATKTISGNETIATDILIKSDEVWRVEDGATLTVSGATLTVEGVLIFTDTAVLVTETRHNNVENKDIAGAVLVKNGGAYFENGKYLFGYGDVQDINGNTVSPTVVLGSGMKVEIKHEGGKVKYSLNNDFESVPLGEADIIAPFVLKSNTVLACGESVNITVNTTGLMLGSLTAERGAEIYNDSSESSQLFNGVINADVYHKVTVSDSTGTNLSGYVKTGYDDLGNITYGKYTVAVPTGMYITSLTVNGNAVENVEELTSYDCSVTAPTTIDVSFAERKIPALINSTFPQYVETNQSFNAVLETNDATTEITINGVKYVYNEAICQNLEGGNIQWTIALTAPVVPGAANYDITVNGVTATKSVTVVAPISLNCSAVSNGATYTSGEWTGSDVIFSVEAVGGIPDSKVFLKRNTDDPVELKSSLYTARETGWYAFYAVDGSGKTTEEVEYCVYIDSNDPQISVVLTPDSDDWQSSVTVEVTVKDLESGFKSLTYNNGLTEVKIDDADIELVVGDAVNITTPNEILVPAEVPIGGGKVTFTIDEDTFNHPNYEFTVTDNVGRTASVTKLIKVDKTPPTVAVEVKKEDPVSSFLDIILGSIVRVNSDLYKVIVNAEDVQAGVKSIKCYILNEGYTTLEDAKLVQEKDGDSIEFNFATLESGRYVIYSVVTDNVGNELTDTIKFESNSSEIIFEVDNSDNEWDVKIDGNSFDSAQNNVVYVNTAFEFTAKASNETKAQSLKVKYKVNAQDNNNYEPLSFLQYNIDRGFVVDGNVLLSQFGIGSTDELCPDGEYKFTPVASEDDEIEYTVIKDSLTPSFSVDVSDGDKYTTEKDLTVKVASQRSCIESVTVNGNAVEKTDDQYKYLISENGTYTITVTSKAGLSDTKEIHVDKIYKSAPELTLTPKEVNGKNGWMKSGDKYAITLSVNSSNKGAVVYQVKDENGYFRDAIINDASQYEIDKDVNREFTFRAIGENGMISEEKTVLVKQDRTLPKIGNYKYSSEPEGFLEKIIASIQRFFTRSTITYLTVDSIEDDLSGLEKVYLAIYDDGQFKAIDGVEKKDYSDHSVRFDIKGNEDVPIIIVAEDKAGNENYIETKTAIVSDKTAPEISISTGESKPVYSDINANVDYFDNQFVTVVTIVDENLKSDGEVTKVTLKCVGKDDKTINLNKSATEAGKYTAEINSTDDGHYTIEVFAKDYAGNTSEKSYEFILDTTSAAVEIGWKEQVSNQENDKTYLNLDAATAVVTVTEDNFDLETSEIRIKKDGETSVYSIGSGKLNWVCSGNKYIAEIGLSGEGVYTIEVLANSFAQKTGTEVQKVAVLDNTKPTYEIRYSYNPIKSFIREATLGLFFKEPVEVTVAVADNIAGIKNVAITLTPGEKSEYKDFVKVETAQEYKVSIEPQFNGTVSVEVTDYAANRAAATTAADLTKNIDLPADPFDKAEIIVDNQVPVISNIEGISEGAYTNKDVSLTFSVTEKNFFENDIEITVLKNGEELEKNKYQYQCTAGALTDKYDFSLKFTDEGEYTVKVNYTDRSGNTAEEKTKSFTIDKTDPVIKIEFNKVAVNKGDEVKYYNGAQFPVTAVITATDLYFDAENSPVTVYGETLTSSVQVPDSYYEISEWKKDPDKENTYKATVVLSGEAIYQISANITDLAKNEASAEDFATLDKTIPTYEIFYSEQPVNPFSSFINSITLGLFFPENIKVTVKAYDEVAGIKSVSINSTLTEGVSDINKAPEAINETFDEGTSFYIKTFSIDPQFRGKIAVKVTDYSENETDATNTKDLTKNVENLPDGFTDAEIIVDTKAPEISDIILKSNEKIWEQNVITGKFASADVSASFKITEANFFKDDVKIEIADEDDQGKKSTTVYYNGKIMIDGEETSEDPYSRTVESTGKDEYTFTLLFSEERDYYLKVSYIDKSGNEAEKKEEQFTIDKTAPVINVVYDPALPDFKSENNISYYKAPVSATVTISEHNFDATNTFIEIIAKDVNGKDIETPKLFVDKDWTKNGNDYSKTIRFDDDANYSIKITSLDYAKNPATEYNNDVTVDKKGPDLEIKFGIDPVKAFINEITLGLFFKETVTVTVTATDSISGVESLNFSGELEFEDSIDTKIEPQNKKYAEKSNSVTEVYSIDPQYRGTVTFVTADYSTNVYNATYLDITKYISDMPEDEYDLLEVIVDNIPPVIDVAYSEENPVGTGKPENGSISYYNKSVTATVTIDEHNFNVKNSIITVTAVDVNGKDLTKANPALYTISDWSQGEDRDKHVATVDFIGDANYTITVNSKDYSGNEAETYSNNLTVDRTAPVIDINNITFKKMDNETDENIIKKYPDFKYFYNGRVIVTVTATDTTSGIKEIAFYTIDYASGSKGYTKYLTPMTADEKNGTVSAAFVVDPNFKGYICARAEDYATNKSVGNLPDGYTRSEGLVIENIHKHRSITLSANSSIIPEREPNENGFYSADLPVKLAISDSFSGIKEIKYQIGSDSPVKIDMKNNSAYSTIQYQWTQNVVINAKENDNNNVPVVLSYVDNAGNPHKTYTTFKMEYKVDVTPPVIDISYDNNTAHNSVYFDNARTMTVKITELNFRSSDVVFKITKDGEEYNALIPLEENWTTSGIDHTHTAQIVFAYDGDYTFDVSCTDLAGNINDGVNYGESVAAQEFTIDNYDPIIEVEYDNEDSANGNYYNKERTATITIEEHNFDETKSIVTVNAKTRENGSTITAPAVSDWQQIGPDTYSAVVHFNGDGFYTLKVSSQDLADRKSTDYDNDEFTVDKTAPEVSVTKVIHKSANNIKVIAPVVTITDDNVNSFDVDIVLKGAKNEEVFLMKKGSVEKQNDGYGDISDSPTRFVYTFDNIKDDDIYTLTVLSSDMAGNQNKVIKAIDGENKTVELDNNSMMFSVNRNGSTYMLSESTQKVVKDRFVNVAPTLVVREINADRIYDYKISVGSAVNVKYIQEGKDFTVLSYNPDEETLRGDKATWYENVYTINKSNFSSDQEYIVALVSQDKATNKNSTMKDACEIQFCLDTQIPLSKITVDGLKDQGRKNVAINAEEATIRIDVTDSNCDVEKCVIELDGKVLNIAKDGNIFVVKDDNTVIGKYDAEKNCFFLNIKNAGEGWQESNHTIIFVAEDKASNKSEEETYKFTLSTNFWFRYFANKPLFYGSIAGLAVIIAGIVLLIMFKKKHDDLETKA
ncbi:MAG: hypothetical protein K5756_04550 [Clostridiales bacterium]|nr:hypothetical protein [Clostridiales bacterium]